jgi:uncharacterized membrane protein
MKNNNDSVGEGLGILILFTFIVLVIVKLEWYIDIPWIVVFAPLWLPLITVFIVGLIMGFTNPPKD